MIKLYTSPTCPTCKMIKTKLTKQNIPYEEIDDIEYLKSKNIMRLPVMEFEDGTMVTSPKEMNDWIKAYMG